MNVSNNLIHSICNGIEDVMCNRMDIDDFEELMPLIIKELYKRHLPSRVVEISEKDKRIKELEKFIEDCYEDFDHSSNTQEEIERLLNKRIRE